MKVQSGKGNSRVLALILAILFLTVASAAWAIPPRHPRRMLERIETIKMWKLMDALNLDSTTALKVFPIIHEMDKKRLELRMKQHVLVQKIEALLKKGPVTGKILDPLATQLFKLNEQISRLPREEYQKLKPLLTKTQLARYLIFQKRFRRELIRHWVMERRGARSGTGPHSNRHPMNHPPRNWP